MSEIVPIVLIQHNEDSGDLITSLNFPKDYSHRHGGVLVCDLVRHIAAMYKVDEDEVWTWVDKERYHHTTDIRSVS